MNRMSDEQREEVARILEQVAREGLEAMELDPCLDAIAETVLPDTIGRYFEAHVTVEPIQGIMRDYDAFAEYCRKIGWRASRFEHDDVDEIAGKWFMSTRHPSHSQTVQMVQGVLNNAPGHILRYKIEETLLDSKCGDRL